MRYTSAVAHTRAKNLFKAGGHVEICKGDEAENIAYCTKEESRVFGKPCAFYSLLNLVKYY